VTAASEHLGEKHRALIYHEPGRFVDGVGGFVRDGLDVGERVLVAIAREKVGWLRDGLGGAADALDVWDADDLYERHGPMLRALMDYLERHARSAHGQVRVVAEQQLAQRSPADVRAYMRYEAASNVAFRGHAGAVLCPYDAEALPEEIVEDALRTHPIVLAPGGARVSELFTEPRSFVRERARVRPPPPGAPVCGLDRLDDIAIARELVRARAEALGLAPHDVDDLTMAAGEVAANAVLHGRPPRTVWIYVDEGVLVCHVHDAGPGPRDPLAGYMPPDRRTLERRGLWVAHQLCEIVEVAADETGTHVYLGMRVPG
jgi:anti-sigma regulatory factor (Ser/Thr protein kinase)